MFDMSLLPPALKGRDDAPFSRGAQ
jgi:hypothetical protein